MEPVNVQQILDNVGEGELITVTFYKKDGTLVTYSGTLDVGANKSESVAIYTDEGWKRFNINNVVSIANV